MRLLYDPPMPALSPTPLILGDNNVWPFRLDADDGGGWLMIDAGFDTVEGGVTSWEVLAEQARAIGCAPGDVRVVIVTHEHIDHAGLAARWAGEGARIVAMPEALPALAAGYAAYAALRARRIEELHRHGCPPDVLDALSSVQRVARRAPRAPALGWAPCPAEALVAARDGDTFALEGGHTLQLIAAPGHTTGNLVAFIAGAEGGAGDLCSGDTLLPATIPTPGLQFPDVATRMATGAASHAFHAADVPRWPSLPPFLRSVERLRALEVRRILPGHGAVVDDPPRLFAQFAQHYARRVRRVRAHLDGAGGSAHDATAYEVARGLFPRLPVARLGQAVTEVIGCVDVLLERGEAVQGAGADRLLRTRLTR